MGNFLTYNGSAAALFGMGNFWTVADPDVDYEDMIKAYANDGSNFMRMSLIAHTVAKRAGLSPTNVIHPFVRTATGGANDGGNKFDLTQFNQTYFDRLLAICRSAAFYSTFIVWIIWDEIPLESDEISRWNYNPFHPNNNINNLGLPSLDAVPEFYDLNNTALLRIQEEFLRKVLNTVGKFPNLIFGISNEYTGGSSWHLHWQTFIDNFEKRFGVTVLTNELEYLGFSPNYTDLISLTTQQTGGSGNWRTSPARPVVNYTMSATKWHDNPSGARRTWFSCFANGGHSSDDSHDGVDPPDQHNSANTLVARGQIADFRGLINRLPINEMSPSFTVRAGMVDSTAEMRLKLGQVYFVYFDNGGASNVDLSDASGTLQREWFRPNAGTYSNQGTETGGSTINFTAPYGTDDAVLLLYKSGQVSAP